MKFEIHITGEKNILEEFDNLKIKNITVCLMDKNNDVLREEYMSSFIIETKNYKKCKKFVNEIIAKLRSKIYRVKIEAPYKPFLVDHAVYIESHFLFDGINDQYPISINKKSGKILCTDRCYEKEYFAMFKVKWRDAEVELCLYDDYIREDFDWFALYHK